MILLRQKKEMLSQVMSHVHHLPTIEIRKRFDEHFGNNMEKVIAERKTLKNR